MAAVADYAAGVNAGDLRANDRTNCAETPFARLAAEQSLLGSFRYEVDFIHQEPGSYALGSGTVSLRPGNGVVIEGRGYFGDRPATDFETLIRVPGANWWWQQDVDGRWLAQECS